jgi:hypothetical protein
VHVQQQILKEDEEWSRKNIFKTRCKNGGKCCKVVIDSSNMENIVVVEMVKKLRLA